MANQKELLSEWSEHCFLSFLKWGIVVGYFNLWIINYSQSIKLDMVQDFLGTIIL